MKINKSLIKAVILDVDNTLAPQDSWLNITRGLGADPKIHERIFADYVAGQSTYLDAKNELIRLWQTAGNSNKNYFERMFAAWDLFPEANDVVQYLRQRYRVCLISGSVDLWIQSVARRLEIEDWYANTTLIWGENDELVDFDYTLEQAAKKVKQKDSLLEKYKLNNRECIAIGDGSSDVLLFQQLVSIAVGDNPYPELLVSATARVRNLLEIKNYL